MKALALELAPKIRVNAVAPGAVLPPADYDDQAIRRLSRPIPLGRVGAADDVARAVVFLASSPFITGHELVVDGGRTVARAEPRLACRS
jgi:pteridine reductase